MPGIKNITTVTLTIALFAMIVVPTALRAEQSIDPPSILEKAVISNGKSMYDTGRREAGAHLAFTGGPNWLHVNGGGCAVCHGKLGWGNIVPSFCSTSTPPITFKYLAGDGYPFSARQNGSHPAYNMLSFKNMLRVGNKPNGYEADFCMPRWRMSDQEIIDLLGYLIKLDKR